MSHFSVLVIGEDYNTMLAPFQENNMDDCPKEYLEFHDVEDEYLDEYKNGKAEYTVLPGGRIVLPWSDEAKKYVRQLAKEEIDPNDSDFEQKAREVGKKIPKVSIPFRETYSTFEKYVEGWHGAESRNPEKGRYGYWENPNCKWDWYLLGGRWSGLLQVTREGWAEARTGERSWMDNSPHAPDFFDSCLIGHLDYDGMRESRRKSRGEGYDEVSKRIQKHSMEAEHIEFMYGFDPTKVTREEYVAIADTESPLQTFAVLKDGEWYERGEMCMFGTVRDEKDPDRWDEEFNKLLRELDPNTRISIVDCHI